MSAHGDLTGWRIAITRDSMRSAELERLCTGAGAKLVCAPAIITRPPDDLTELKHRLAHLEQVDWLVVTSPRAVEIITELRPTPWPATLRIACVGPQTRRALEAVGESVDVVPESPGAAALIAALAGQVAGRRVLLPQSSIALPAARDGLARAGAEVETVVAYETRPDLAQAGELVRRIEARQIEAVIVTSPSALAALLEAAGDPSLWSGRARIVSMGPTTTEAITRRLRPPDAEAGDTEAASLLAAVCDAMRHPLDDTPTAKTR